MSLTARILAREGFSDIFRQAEMKFGAKISQQKSPKELKVFREFLNTPFVDITIPFTRPLATALKEMDNEDAVHLAVTAKGSYQRQLQSKGMTRDTMQLPSFPRFSIPSALGRSPFEEAKFTDYVSVQVHPDEAIHDGLYLGTFTMINPLKEPLPVGPLVPLFYGYYMVDEEIKKAVGLPQTQKPAAGSPVDKEPLSEYVLGQVNVRQGNMKSPT
ncbi:hypothetical protein BDZ97DRAFT_1920960 [Flammula alnicola]|nr:hypothetical protein BDZ97DRAFT_1920960 [Flammula alnicola]